jgi:hypothetical protein
MSQKGEAQSSLRLIFAPRNPLILFVPIFRAKILISAPRETRGSATF